MTMISKYDECDFGINRKQKLKNLIFHIDLKGMPPVFERLLKHLELYAAAGYTAVLVEWEDMFPWKFNKKLRNPNAYTPEQIEVFAQHAGELGLEVIPLVQSLGHMEFVLGWPEFSHLREMPERMDGLNPALPEAGELISTLIDEVLELLPETRRFHLGGDEVYTLGQSEQNKKFIEQYGKDTLYLNHMAPLLYKLSSRGITPMLWCDMMHDWPEDKLKTLADKAELIAWGYQKNAIINSAHSSKKHIINMLEQGIKVWGALACKGADAIDGILPDYDARMGNAGDWIEIANELQLEGLIATAWSRYDSTNVNCDPLEGALDCVIAGGLLRKGAIPEKYEVKAFLAIHNEEEEFEKRRQILAEFDYAKQQTWAWIIRTKQLDYLKDANRCQEVLNMRNHYSHAQRNMKIVLKTATILEKEFSGLCFPNDIKRFLEERLTPLNLELKHLETRIKKVYPGLEPEIELP